MRFVDAWCLVFQLIAEGSAKLASVPSGGGAASSSAAAGGAPAAAAEEKVEEKKEEEKVRYWSDAVFCLLRLLIDIAGGIRRRHGLRSVRLDSRIIVYCMFTPRVVLVSMKTMYMIMS